MNYISKRVINLAPSGIRKFFDLVLGMKNVISLGVGEPDFVTPWHIRETAIHAIEQGYTSYTSNKGLQELRRAITEYLKQHYYLKYNPDSEILITVGVSEALDLAVRAIIDPGDKILIPRPCYVSYGAVVDLAGGIPVYLQTDKATGFKINPLDIEKKCDRKTKAIMINYPANPTGTSYTKKELEILQQVIRKNNLIVITDEIYCDLTYDFEHTPWPTLNGEQPHCIYLNGFSKGHAMTGWRIGYACGPREIIEAMTKIHQYTMLCAPTISQFAALDALQKGAQAVAQMKEEYNRRRRFIVKALNKLGFSCHLPQGAFYVFPDISPLGFDCIDFANQLLKKQHVAVVPGTAFDPQAKKFVRMAYATNMEQLREAVSRMEKFINQ